MLSPAGKIVFTSAAFPGRITDYDLVRLSGFLDLVEKGDCFAADKGVTVQSLLLPLGAKIIMPPRKLANQKQFSADAVYEGQSQAKVRVHIERAIRKVKTYKYISRRQPLHTLRYFSKCVWFVVFLVNLWGAPIGPAHMVETVVGQKVRTSLPPTPSTSGGTTRYFCWQVLPTKRLQS
jgi:hypothetical protein